ncbi:MAG: hypothetical protein ACRC0L_07265, partial [Angustibacter sp.]
MSSKKPQSAPEPEPVPVEEAPESPGRISVPREGRPPVDPADAADFGPLAEFAIESPDGFIP